MCRRNRKDRGLYRITVSKYPKGITTEPKSHLEKIHTNSGILYYFSVTDRGECRLSHRGTDYQCPNHVKSFGTVCGTEHWVSAVTLPKPGRTLRRDERRHVYRGPIIRKTHKNRQSLLKQRKES